MKGSSPSSAGIYSLRRQFERSRIEVELLTAVYDALLAAPCTDSFSQQTEGGFQLAEIGVQPAGTMSGTL
jgi:hypothetical protein